MIWRFIKGVWLGKTAAYTLLGVLILIVLCDSGQAAEAGSCFADTPLSGQSWPIRLVDDPAMGEVDQAPGIFFPGGELESLGMALDGSIAALKSRPPAQSYGLCGRSYTVSELLTGLELLGDIIRGDDSGQAKERRIRGRFDLCSPAGENGSRQILVTGYFEPLLEGRRFPDETFKYPLYRVPPDLVRRNGRIGRLIDDEMVPYWTRAEIENSGLLSGLELVYLNDPLEAFILHVQGSGLVRLADGSVRPVQFGAKNGRSYRSIGRLLVERGVMELDEVTLPSIISYLKKHPSQRTEILQQNESFIFFRWGDDTARTPLGSLGVALTAGRSVALDARCFPPGAAVFLETKMPVMNRAEGVVSWRRTGRLVFHQDSGSAIKGAARLDLFLGHGGQARAAAGILKQPGNIYFLLPKK